MKIADKIFLTVLAIVLVYALLIPVYWIMRASKLKPGVKWVWTSGNNPFEEKDSTIKEIVAIQSGYIKYRYEIGHGYWSTNSIRFSTVVYLGEIVK